MKRYIFYVALAIIILSAILNPTQNDFQDYLTGTGIIDVSTINVSARGYGRTGYYLVFSTYRYNYTYWDGSPQSKRYIGVFKNFIEL